MDKSYSEQMEEQLEPRPSKYKPIHVSRFVSPLFTDREIRLSEFFPAPSAHHTYVMNRVPRGVHYDPTDDGPEVRVIKTLRSFYSVNKTCRQIADTYITVGAGYLLLAKADKCN